MKSTKGEVLICPECGIEFEQRRWNQKYCCHSHKQRVNERRFWRRASSECRRRTRERKRQWRQKAKETGLCVACGAEPAEVGTFCIDCHLKVH